MEVYLVDLSKYQNFDKFRDKVKTDNSLDWVIKLRIQMQNLKLSHLYQTYTANLPSERAEPASSCSHSQQALHLHVVMSSDQHHFRPKIHPKSLDSGQDRYSRMIISEPLFVPPITIKLTHRRQPLIWGYLRDIFLISNSESKKTRIAGTLNLS